MQFRILEKDFADQSPKFTFKDFKKHSSVVEMSDHADAESAAEWYAKNSDSWEWPEGEPHEFLVANKGVTCLRDLEVIAVTTETVLRHNTRHEGNYSR